MSKLTMLSAGALVAAALVAGCSNQSTDGATTSTSPTSAAASSPSAAEAHNDADVMFSQHMIPHHQQAIEMSDMILGKPGIDLRVIDLANTIKAAQGPEIEKMQGWLTEWGVPPMAPMMPPMMPHTGMPGPAHGEA